MISACKFWIVRIGTGSCRQNRPASQYREEFLENPFPMPRANKNQYQRRHADQAGKHCPCTRPVYACFTAGYSKQAAAKLGYAGHQCKQGEQTDELQEQRSAPDQDEGTQVVSVWPAGDVQ